MNINTTSNLAPAIQEYYNRNLLDRLVPKFVFDLFADRELLPTSESSTQKFRKYNSLAEAMVPVSEDEVPDGGLASYTDVEFDLEQYAYYLKYTDKVSLTNPDPILTEFGKMLTEQAMRTIEKIRRDSYVAGTQVRRAGGVAARGSIINTITNNDLDVVERSLLGSYNDYFTDFIDASNGYATSPVPPSFPVIAHTDAKADIKGLTGFTSVEKYAGQTKVYPTEIGAVGNFRFLLSPLHKVWADTGGTAVTNSLKYTTASSACDVYAMLVYTPHAVCVSDLMGHGLQNIIKPLGYADPINKFGTSAWVAWLAQGILDDTRLYRIEHGVSELS